MQLLIVTWGMKLTAALLVVLALLFAGLSTHAQSKPVLNHIALYVKDLKKSTTFYTDILKLDTIPEPFHDGKHTWLAVSEHSHLHLIEGAKSVTTHDKNSHLCFSVPSVDEVISRLNDNKIGYENWPGKKQEVTTRVDGVKQIYFTDPDGYWIEINDDYPKANK